MQPEDTSLLRIFDMPAPKNKVRLPTLTNLSDYFTNNNFEAEFPQESTPSSPHNDIRSDLKETNNHANITPRSTGENHKEITKEPCPSTQRHSAPINQLCIFYMRGYCDKHAECRFVHDAASNTKYKTQLCTHYQQGSCAFGSRCSFAHGQSDLKVH